MRKQLTSKEYFSQLTLIYFAQAGIMLIFAGVVFALVYLGKVSTTTDESFTRTLTYILLVIVVAGFAGAHFLYQFMLAKIDRSLSLPKKTQKYVGVLLTRSACLEFPGLAASVVFFLTGNFYLLLIPLFTGIVFFLLRPTQSSVIEDLNLSEKEKGQLNNPKTIVIEQ